MQICVAPLKDLLLLLSHIVSDIDLTNSLFPDQYSNYSWLVGVGVGFSIRMDAGVLLCRTLNREILCTLVEINRNSEKTNL